MKQIYPKSNNPKMDNYSEQWCIWEIFFKTLYTYKHIGIPNFVSYFIILPC